MTRRQKRLIGVAAVVTGVGTAAALGLTALQKNLLYFYTPSQVLAGEVPDRAAVRLGGLVVGGSVVREPDSLVVRFDLTDGGQPVTVRYKGVLPDLFREGQGIVAQGRLQPAGVFEASEVLAKHDENYMPPEVASALAEREAPP
jgi:cytochrome c-type biogenesis protein CcmE